MRTIRAPSRRPVASAGQAPLGGGRTPVPQYYAPGRVRARRTSARWVRRLENALPPPWRHHVALHHVAHNPGDERVAAWLDGQPVLPLQLVRSEERRVGK